MARPRKPPRLNRREENNVWEIIYFCETAGRTVRRSLGTEVEKVARERFADWLVRYSPEDMDEEVVTVGDILSYYMNFVERDCLAKANVRSAVGHLRDYFGAMPARSLTAKETNAYTAMRRAKVKNATVRAELSKLRAAYSHAAKNAFGGINHIPAFGLPPMSEPKGDYIEKDDMKRLLDYLVERRGSDPIDDLEVIITLAFRTAARKGAILDLTWDRVRFDLGHVDYQTPEWKALPRKHRSKRRAIVPMSDKLRDFLMQLKEERNPEPTDRLVTMAHATIYRAFDRLAAESGIKVQPHLLRRTYGSIASMAGVPTKEISRVMGNTEKIAEERYIRFNPKYLRDAVEID